MTLRRSLFAVAFAAPLALAVGACGRDGDTAAAVPKADALAAVPAPAGKAWSDVVAATPAGGMVMGNPAAPIKLIEYGSLSCPHCARFAQEGFASLKDKYVSSGRVSLEFRSFAIHPQDLPLTLLAQCAGPATFFPMIEELYKNFDAVSDRTMQGAKAAEATSNLPPAQRLVAMSQALGFTDFVAARGISQDQANACLADPKGAERVAKTSETATSQGIDSTPSFLLNGTKLTSAGWGPDKLRNDPGVEAALQNAGAR
ncbi:MAG: thioredoxin domain-containing protein [Croceibacterium sp.]